MAGSFVSVDVIGGNEITNALNKLLKQTNNLSPAFKEIGDHLIESTQKRMSQEQSPSGEEWEPLSASTIKQKAFKRQPDTILRGYGTLADTLNYQLSDNQLMFGSNMEYAATHQFGRESANIPAREFLGFSDSDENEIMNILRTHLS